MQRGAHHRDVDPSPVTSRELYEVSPPKLTENELIHFQHGNRSFDKFFEDLRPVLAACRKAQMPATVVAKILNSKSIKTGASERWTPRLAWFLMATFRAVERQRERKEKQFIDNKNSLKRSFSERAEGTKHEVIERDVARVKKHGYEQQLRKQFTSTLGDACPQLSELKARLEGKK